MTDRLDVLRTCDGLDLRRPADQTPLAEVEPALGFLGVLGSVLRRGPVATKLAVLKSLATEGSGPWRIEELQELVDWLGPASTVRVVQALRSDEILEYQETLRRYVLTTAGRRVMLLVDVLLQPGNERQIIRELDALIAHARARGDHFAEILHLFAMAVAQLRDARDQLEEMLATDTRETLLGAAERADEYAEQMRALWSHHDDVLGRHRFDADAGPVLTSASELVPQVAKLVYRAYDRLSDDSRELRRYGLRIDRDTVRSFVAKQDVATLAELVSPIARPSPAVPAIDIGAAAQTLLERIRRAENPTPVPRQPRSLPVLDSPEPVADRIELMVERLRRLTAPTSLAEIVVGDSWEQTVAQHVRALVALTYEDEGMPALTTDAGRLKAMDRGGAWRMSEATLIPETP